MKKGIVLLEDAQEALLKLSDKDAGAVVKALAGGEVKLSSMANLAFGFIKGQVDRINELSEKRSDAGRKGMANRWGDNKVITNDNKVITNHNKTITNDNPNTNTNTNTKADTNTKANTKANTEPLSVHFVPPTIRDVEDYAFEKGLNIDAKRFVNYYASKGWMVGRTKMKDWKAAARNWAARDKKPAGGFETFSAMCDEGDGMKVWDAI